MTTSASANEASIDVRPANDGPVRALLRLTETAQFLRSTDGRVHARVSIGGRPEIFAIRSPEFRDWLIDGYSRTCGETPSDWSIRRVRARLEANARFQSDTSSVFIRVGHDGDANANANANGNGNGSAFYLFSNYNENRQEAAMTHLEDSPLAAILLEHGADLDGWYGTPSKLLELLYIARESRGCCLAPLAEIADAARHRAAPVRPPTPPTRHIRSFRPRKSRSHPVTATRPIC
jgi:hypothetical protein